MSMSDEEILQLHTAVVVAGHTGDAELALRLLDHDVARIRSAAISALERLGCLDDSRLGQALHDSDPRVRRRAAEIAAAHPSVDLGPLLDDHEPLVVEMAAWACGEQLQSDDDYAKSRGAVEGRIIDRLIDLSKHHDDPLVRESAVAALGAIGDERAIPAIITCCSDKPAVRRRAVLALAPFSGAEVDRALRHALQDRDWQVRQAAEDVLGPLATSIADTFDDQQDTEQNEEN